jgi:cytosine/adenosine deaminase-related metal-dependent hydrolase
MNNELQSALTPQHASIDYEGEHSRHAVRNAQGTRTLIHNAPFIFTCDENDKVQILKNHSIIVSGDTITDVVPANGINHDNFDIVYDAGKRGGTVIMPGFINTHTHPPMYLMRSAMMLDEGEGIDETIAAMPLWERAMSNEDYTVATLGDITEQQKYGITTLLSHYGVLEPVDDAARITRHNVVNAVSAVSNTHPENSPAWLKKLLQQQERFYAKTAVAVHYLYKATPETLQEIKKLVDEFDTLFTFHMAESEMVAAACVKNFGARETDVLKKFGLLNDRAIASHVIYVNDDEIAKLTAAGVGIAHLPTSNAIHKSGTFPFWKFYDAGGLPRLSLGTDGVVSKSRLDLITEAYQTRITHLYERTVKFSSLFKMLTSNGARVLRMQNRGRIAPGFKADLSFWKLKDRGCIPYDQNEPMTLLGNIITHGGRTVRDLMINGRFIIKNRRHQLVDESKLLGLLQMSHMEMRQRVAEK